MAFAKAALKGTNIARDLCNTRGTEADCDFMEAHLRKIVNEAPEASKKLCTIEMIKGTELRDQGFGLFYAVGKGAQIAPRYMAVHYQGDPSKKDETEIALIGKGLTYDTGGLNLKPTGSMEDMHMDKGGACAVMGALSGCLDLQIKKNIVFVFGFAENAIGSLAYKPGDIITSLKGLTVEIGNTDAEGRLVLADSMTYTCRKYKPQQVIELSTLTGAVLVALGAETAGVFSNKDELVEKLKKASKESNEPIWHLPITNEHREAMKRTQADLNNMGKTRFGGASQAAAFLECFLEKNTGKDNNKVADWAHIDIAGAAKPKDECTGFGAHLLLKYLTNKN